MPHIRENRTLSAVFLAGALILISACSGDGASDDIGRSVQIELSHYSARPASSVEILGLDPQEYNPAELTIYLEEFEAPVQLNTAGKLVFVVPLVQLDGNLPASSQDLPVNFYHAGKLLAQLDQSFTVEVLPSASQTTAAIADELVSLTSDLKTVVESLYAEESVDRVIIISALEAYRQLLEDDENSLQEILSGTSTEFSLSAEELELLDALFASSGTLELLSQLSKQLGLATQSPYRARLASNPGTLDCGTYPPDLRLACKMQLYQIIKDIGGQVINPTAQTFGLTAGSVVSVIGIGAPVAAYPAGMVGAFVSLFDFIVNKIVVGVLPAKVTQFYLEVPDKVVSIDEVIESNVMITAENDAPNITLVDMISQLLNTLGMQQPQQIQIYTEVLENAGDAFLNIFVNLLSAYGSEYNMDITLDNINMPYLVWGPIEITSTELVTPYSFDHDIVSPADETVHWVSGQNYGEVSIDARIRTGSEILLFSLPSGIEYSYGAFGDNILITDPVTIKVAPELVINASMAETIDPSGINGIEVRVGYRDPLTEEVNWNPDINVTLSVTGGYLETDSGVTDAEGYFFSSVELADCSLGVEIGVLVEGIAGSEESTTLSSENSNDITMTINPQNPRLDPDEYVDFDVTVAGTVCSDVLWSAEGGTISSTSGEYVAGNETGQGFQVTATLVSIPGVNASTSIVIGGLDITDLGVGAGTVDSTDSCSYSYTKGGWAEIVETGEELQLRLGRESGGYSDLYGFYWRYLAFTIEEDGAVINGTFWGTGRRLASGGVRDAIAQPQNVDEYSSITGNVTADGLTFNYTWDEGCILTYSYDITWPTSDGVEINGTFSGSNDSGNYSLTLTTIEGVISGSGAYSSSDEDYSYTSTVDSTGTLGDSILSIRLSYEGSHNDAGFVVYHGGIVNSETLYLYAPRVLLSQ